METRRDPLRAALLHHPQQWRCVVPCVVPRTLRDEPSESAPEFFGLKLGLQQAPPHICGAVRPRLPMPAHFLPL